MPRYVEVPKLHNIKLLASFYTHIDYNYHDEFCCMCNQYRETQIVANDRP